MNMLGGWAAQQAHTLPEFSEHLTLGALEHDMLWAHLHVFVDLHSHSGVL